MRRQAVNGVTLQDGSLLPKPVAGGKMQEIRALPLAAGGHGAMLHFVA